MSSELPCYTIINNSSESEPPNEQQLKHDIGALSMVGGFFVINKTVYRRTWRYQSEDQYSEENHTTGFEWGAPSRTAYDHHSFHSAFE